MTIQVSWEKMIHRSAVTSFRGRLLAGSIFSCPSKVT
jgi:hypothetical protein